MFRKVTTFALGTNKRGNGRDTTHPYPAKGFFLIHRKRISTHKGRGFILKNKDSRPKLQMFVFRRKNRINKERR